jgi:hypothetical protein
MREIHRRIRVFGHQPDSHPELLWSAAGGNSHFAGFHEIGKQSWTLFRCA